MNHDLLPFFSLFPFHLVESKASYPATSGEEKRQIGPQPHTPRRERAARPAAAEGKRKWCAKEASTLLKAGLAGTSGIRCVSLFVEYICEEGGSSLLFLGALDPLVRWLHSFACSLTGMLWEMRLRSRHWLMRRDWKQLAPDDAYLSCEYSPCLPGGRGEG